jgi:hypothetical protein
MPVRTAAEYAFLRHCGNGVPAARKGAEKLWQAGAFAERADAEHVLIYGREAPVSVLTSEPPQPDEGGPGWGAEETDRFGLLARRLWRRLLVAEKLVQL